MVVTISEKMSDKDKHDEGTINAGRADINSDNTK